MKSKQVLWALKSRGESTDTVSKILQLFIYQKSPINPLLFIKT